MSIKKSYLFIFAFAMLLPNLAWACGGSGSYAEGIIANILNWAIFIYWIIFFVGLIILNVLSALKKDEENKRSNWWMVFAAMLLAFNFIVFYIQQSLVVSISLIILSAINIILAFRKNKENKKLKRWMIFAVVLFVCSLLLIVFIKALQSLLLSCSVNF